MTQLVERRLLSLLIPFTIVAIDDVNSLPLEMLFGGSTTSSAPASTAAATTYHSQYIITERSPVTSSNQKQQHFTKLQHHSKPRCKHYGQYINNNSNNKYYGSWHDKLNEQEYSMPSSIVLSSAFRNGGEGCEQNPPQDSTEATDSASEGSISSSSEETTVSKGMQNELKGRFLLAFVAFLYGTLNVSLRQLYALPGPPSASALSFTRGWLAAISFVPILLQSQKQQKHQQQKQVKPVDQPFLQVELGADEAASISSSSIPQEMILESNKNKVPPLWIAAFELALWNFGAQALFNIGLLYTESARASFLAQTSVVITPLISMLAGQAVSKSVWVGCGLALSGLLLLSGGKGSARDAAASAFTGSKDLPVLLMGALTSIKFSSGDLLILGGALSWSMYLFRMSKVGSRYPEVSLQALKTMLLATLYSSWFVSSMVQCYAAGGWTDVANLWSGWRNLSAWAILAYSAAGPGAIADILQQQGQKEVSATEANIILSAEPIFTAICGYLLLREVTTARENAGGAMIVLAALLASRG